MMCYCSVLIVLNSYCSVIGVHYVLANTFLPGKTWDDHGSQLVVKSDTIELCCGTEEYHDPPGATFLRYWKVAVFKTSIKEFR